MSKLGLAGAFVDVGGPGGFNNDDDEEAEAETLPAGELVVGAAATVNAEFVLVWLPSTNKPPASVSMPSYNKSRKGGKDRKPTKNYVG